MTPQARQYLEQQKDLGFRTLYLSEPPRTKSEALLILQEKYQTCAACGLSKTRKHMVFGSGNPEARLLFVGEAPGADEDAQGLPFVGAAGQLLTKMIEGGMGIPRKDVYIANILKCRPPGNRDPMPAETNACTGILKEQIKIINPEFICALGRVSGRFLLKLPETATLKSMRGRIHKLGGSQVVVTYHPSALLQHAEWKKDAWEDLKLLMGLMGLALPVSNK